MFSGRHRALMKLIAWLLRILVIVVAVVVMMRGSEAMWPTVLGGLRVGTMRSVSANAGVAENKSR